MKERKADLQVVGMKAVPPEALELLSEAPGRTTFRPLEILRDPDSQIALVSRRGIPYQSYSYFQGRKWVIVAHIGDSPGVARTLLTALHKAVRHWNKSNKPKREGAGKPKVKSKSGRKKKAKPRKKDRKQPSDLLADAERLLDIR